MQSAQGEEVPHNDLANIAKTVTGGGNVDKDSSIECFDCDANDPCFEHSTEEQIVAGTLSLVLEDSEEENFKTWKQVCHEATLAHALTVPFNI